VWRHISHFVYIFGPISFIDRPYDYNGGSVWHAKPFRLALAKQAAIARDRNCEAHAMRDRNPPLISEGLHTLRRKLICGVAVPEPSRIPGAPRVELTCCGDSAADLIPSSLGTHLELTQDLNLLGQVLVFASLPQA
jgi:hypothetical protein